MRRVLIAAALIIASALPAFCAAREIPGHEYIGPVEIRHAEKFTADRYEGGITLIRTADGREYLVVPRSEDTPHVDGCITVKAPIERAYIAATSAMSFFRALDSMDAVRMSGTKREGWFIEEAASAMERGGIVYAGKYSAPDYEMLISEGCGLAVESTMISHKPDVLKKFDELGIPAAVDLSSTESRPLGRVEWIKFYGALLGRESEAERAFAEQEAAASQSAPAAEGAPTVAFFYATTSGTIAVRGPNDYIPTLIGMAGGRYVPAADGAGEHSGTSMTLESFCGAARDADFIIYNETVDSTLESVGELLEKSELFAGFKAVREGRVWCTGKHMHQATDLLGYLARDIRLMLEGETDASKFTFIRRLDR